MSQEAVRLQQRNKELEAELAKSQEGARTAADGVCAGAGARRAKIPGTGKGLISASNVGIAFCRNLNIVYCSQTLLLL